MKLSLLKKIIYFFVFCLFSLSSFAQTGTFRGHVYDKYTGEPIIFCNLILQETETGTTTDYDGFFIMPNLPVGKYNLKVSYIGYDSFSTEIVINKGSVLYKKIVLEESSITLGEVSVSAAREQQRTTVNVSQISISPKQIKALPSVGGEADIVQYLQVLPGVITTGDQGGQIFIRGGSPVQNKILLDGLNIFNPFHSVGFYSVFETEIIKNVDVLSGAFGAEHGGRISAIVDIKTKEGNKVRQSGFISGGPFMAKALIEGPIKKFDESGTSVSYVLTGKKSLIQETSKTLYKYAADDPEIGLPFNFQDIYGKVSINTANGSRLNLFGFNFDDGFRNPLLADINWNNVGGGLNFYLIPQGSTFVIDGLIGYTSYKVGISEQDNLPRRSEVDEISAMLNFTNYGTNNEVKYGLEMRSLRTDFEFFNPFRNRIQQEQNTTEIGFYGKYRQILGKFIIEPSLRSQYYASLAQFTLEPRIGLKYNANDKFRIKAAAGKYTQNLLSTSDERDVVNLFNGFLTGPQSQITGLEGERITNRLQLSNHAILGFEWDVFKNIQINIEGYLKDFPQLIVVNRNKLSPSDADYVIENGKAYGIDLSLKYDNGPLYVWMTYSHGYVNRFDGVQTYPTIFDRRHNANFLTSYNLDKAGTWLASVRWNLGSGFPFTLTRGFYNQQQFSQGVETDILTSNPNDLGILFSPERNGGRLPYYHRLDMSVTKKIKFSKYAGLEIVGSVTNAYNRPNMFYFNRVTYQRVDQLPILPTLSMKLYF